MSRIERVGIIGLGKMGRPKAKNLVAGGFWLTGYGINGRAEKDMTIVLREADSARISLAISGTSRR
ncbi:MAG: NAD(P)-binding domain-containing protein [Alphaproteobacteria bacterium]